MNRITGNLTFFDGEKWSLPPIPAAKPLAPQPLPEPVPAASPSASPSPQPEPAAVTRPEAKEEAGVSNKEKAPPEKQAIRPAAAKGYAIQIAAMRNINSAQELAEKQRMSGQPAYMAIIKSKDQEVLHGVFIGRFAKKWEAARYMEEKKMKNFFPGCFIQTLP
jgi:cell division septation protein DedD